MNYNYIIFFAGIALTVFFIFSSFKMIKEMEEEGIIKTSLKNTLLVFTLLIPVLGWLLTFVKFKQLLRK